MIRRYVRFVFVMVAGLATFPAAAARIQGDLNAEFTDEWGETYPEGDGGVTTGDLALLMRQQLGLVTFDAAQLEAADVAPQVLGAPTGNGVVDLADVHVLSQFVRGIDVDRDGLSGAVLGLEWQPVPYYPFNLYTSGFESDTDHDGLCDGANVQYGSVSCTGEIPSGANPLDPDTDDDGICDGKPAGATTCVSGELIMGTSPIRSDTDGDGIRDTGEDLDYDGVQDPGETIATNPDTDNDDRCDGKSRQAWEIDGDPVCTGSEYFEGSDPLVADGPIDPSVTVACPNCFAVFVIPDTQYYVVDYTQGGMTKAAEHLKQTMDYICQNQNAWREPSTKKVMPILMTLQLGDLIDNAYVTPTGPPSEWQRIDAAFDRLDACGARYLVTAGNHDTEPPYVAGSPGQPSLASFSQYFTAPCNAGDPTLVCNNPTSPFYDASGTKGRQAWREHRCANPLNCDWLSGEWYIGNGPDVNLGGTMGIEPGRHRAGLIQAPNGDEFLFVGIDYNGYNLAWIQSMMAAYPDAATLLFHHEAFITEGGVVLGGPVLTQLVQGRPQVFMGINGHFAGATQTALTNEHSMGFRRLQFDFQDVPAPPPNGYGYGDGWQGIMVFDPDWVDPNTQQVVGQIRFRSYRIADAQYYKTQWQYTYLSHGVLVDFSRAGALQPTWLLDTDYRCGVYSDASCPQSWGWNIQ